MAEKSPPTRSSTELILIYLPVALLIFVALLQVDTVRRHDLTPWKGGGFGMFSTVDRTSLRRVRCVAVHGEEEVVLALPRRFDRRIRTVTSMPSERNLTEFAEALLREPSEVERDAIRVEVWRSRFDSQTNELQMTKIREATARRRSRP